jgi:glycine/D-amino acid oxidase-like deaminating enzyme
VRDTVWFRTLGPADRDVLAADDDLPGAADVVVVGAGLIGLSTAYYLAEAGVRGVCVVDRDGPLAEAGGANAGGLWFAHESAGAPDAAALAALSARLYREIGERFDCDLARRGVLELAYDDADIAVIENRAASIRAGGYEAQIVGTGELRRIEPGLSVEAAGLLVPGAGQVHPAKLAAAWARRIRAAGGRICRSAEVRRLGATVETARGNIAAGRVVVAAGSWTPLLTRELGWAPPIRPIRGTLLALPAGDRKLFHTVMARRYYYWQLENGPVAGGGSLDDVGFEPGVLEATVADIRAELDRHFPALAATPTEVAWSGFRPWCADSRPAIGAVPGSPNVFVGAGHFRKGVMLAPATGKVLADLVTGRAPEVDLAPFDPARFAWQAA